MPGATPLYGWPYPIAADPLDDAVSVTPQAMATAMENTLAALYAGGVPGAGWITFPWAASWSNHGSLNGGQYSKYGSKVYVDAYGIRATSSFASGGVVGTLPAGYRPTRALPPTRPVLINSGGTFTIGYASVATTGAISVTTSAGAAIPVGSALLMTFEFPTN